MTSRPITMDEYKLIIQTMYEGGLGFRPNPKIALLLQLEASCGLRVSDSKSICLNNIYRTSDNRYRLKIKEKKTGKHRDTFFFEDLYYKLSEYCIENGIKKDEPIFKITTRQVNKYGDHYYVVLSNTACCIHSPVVHAVPLSSNCNRRLPTQVEIYCKNLPKRSFALAEQLTLLPKSALEDGKLCGYIENESMKRVHSAIKIQLSLN